MITRSKVMAVTATIIMASLIAAVVRGGHARVSEVATALSQSGKDDSYRYFDFRVTNEYRLSILVGTPVVEYDETNRLCSDWGGTAVLAPGQTKTWQLQWPAELNKAKVYVTYYWRAETTTSRFLNRAANAIPPGPVSKFVGRWLWTHGFIKGNAMRMHTVDWASNPQHLADGSQPSSSLSIRASVAAGFHH
jgi:hypothetical protein